MVEVKRKRKRFSLERSLCFKSLTSIEKLKPTIWWVFFDYLKPFTFFLKINLSSNCILTYTYDGFIKVRNKVIVMIHRKIKLIKIDKI